MTPSRDHVTSVLKHIAEVRLTSQSGELPPALELEAALRSSLAELTPMPATEAELAQAALDVLAEDPEFFEPVQTTLAQPAVTPGKYMDASSGIALITAAILVLQTRVKAKKDSTGKWSVEIEKKDLNSGALKILIERLLPFLGK